MPRRDVQRKEQRDRHPPSQGRRGPEGDAACKACAKQRKTKSNKQKAEAKGDAKHGDWKKDEGGQHLLPLLHEVHGHADDAGGELAQHGREHADADVVPHLQALAY